MQSSDGCSYVVGVAKIHGPDDEACSGQQAPEMSTTIELEIIVSSSVKEVLNSWDTSRGGITGGGLQPLRREGVASGRRIVSAQYLWIIIVHFDFSPQSGN